MAGLDTSLSIKAHKERCINAPLQIRGQHGIRHLRIPIHCRIAEAPGASRPLQQPSLPWVISFTSVKNASPNYAKKSRFPRAQRPECGIQPVSIAKFRARAQAKYYRLSADHLFKRPFTIRTNTPIISFTFDDFPETALSIGGAILKKYGLAGTFYVSLGLAGTHGAAGTMFALNDLKALRQNGHELGCHTFAHCDSSATETRVFEESVTANGRALGSVLPDASFRTFSYPISAPRARTKQTIGRRFVCCRGSGQTFNSGVADLNYLKAYFLEKSLGDTPPVKQMIDSNQVAKGWLILATHDVCDKPSPYGCTPDFFETIVQHALESGAKVLPVVNALEALQRT
jgi:peptidoglycan/xylan/chitin deacetylase (PgdA/CDA1 family)